jgi:hypothetical protein
MTPQSKPGKGDFNLGTSQAIQIIYNHLGRRVSRPTMLHLLEEGQVDAKKLHPNGFWNVSRSSLMAYIERVRNDPPPDRRPSQKAARRKQAQEMLESQVASLSRRRRKSKQPENMPLPLEFPA